MIEKITRLRAMAREAIQQYSDEVFSGGEPVYPQWARDLLDVLDADCVKGLMPCTLPPDGWRCTRSAGHEGPCAAVPVSRLPTSMQGADPVKEQNDCQRCACHPDDRPQGPCRRQYAATDCQAIQPSVPDGWKSSVQKAYGYLWMVNNEPGTPNRYAPEKAAYEARKLLRDLLTNTERGDGINAVMLTTTPPADEQPQTEDVQAIIACLEADAGTLRDTNPDDEMAANMDAAATLLRQRWQTPPADGRTQEPLHITHAPLIRNAISLLRLRMARTPDVEQVVADLEKALDGMPTPAGEPSQQWLDVAAQLQPDTERWEIGLRNIVTILGGARKPFEIKEVVETIRKIVHGESEGSVLPWYEFQQPADKVDAQPDYKSLYQDEQKRRIEAEACADMLRGAQPDPAMAGDSKIEFDAWFKERGVWPRLTYEEIFNAGWQRRQRVQPAGDMEKTSADWFWLIGYPGGKALIKQMERDKVEQHIIATAAGCLEWHAAMFGKTDMRPGIDAAQQQGGQS